MEEAKRLKLEGSPTFFLNGARYNGAAVEQQQAELFAAVDRELEAAQKAKESGVAARDLYGFRCNNNFGHWLVASQAR